MTVRKFVFTGRPKKEHAKNRLRHLGVRISEEMRRNLDAESDRQQRSVADIVNEALDDYMSAVTMGCK